MSKLARHNAVIVLVTCPNAPEARRIALALVEERLAACVNVLSAPVYSVYRWKGKRETASEVLLIIKSTRRRLIRLTARIRTLHSYETPEIIALPVVAGSAQYLRWLSQSVAFPRPSRGKTR